MQENKSRYAEPTRGAEWRAAQKAKEEKEEEAFFDGFEEKKPVYNNIVSEQHLAELVDEILDGMDKEAILKELDEYMKWYTAFGYMRWLKRQKKNTIHQKGWDDMISGGLK